MPGSPTLAAQEGSIAIRNWRMHFGVMSQWDVIPANNEGRMNDRRANTEVLN